MSKIIMKMEKIRIFVFFIVIVGLVWVGTAAAIDVPDASFENLAPDGGWAYVNDVSSPWYCSSGGSSGAWIAQNYVQGNGYPQVGHDSSAYVEMNGLYVSQVLTETYVEGQEYELSAWSATHLGATGQRIFGYFTDGVNTLYDSGAQIVPTSTGSHTWYKYVFTYIATSSDAGKNIGIQFLGDGDTNVDDVTLTIAGTVKTVIVTPTDLSVTEGEPATSYEISLTVEPDYDVEVTLTPSDAEIKLNTAAAGEAVTLTFLKSAWSDIKTVTVTAEDDSVYEGDIPHTTTISHSAVSDDDDYTGIAISDVQVEVTDDELTCGDWGYLPMDLTRDCYVNLRDFAEFALEWLKYE